MFFVLLLLCIETRGIISVSVSPADTTLKVDSPTLPVLLLDDAPRVKRATLEEDELPSAPAVVVDVASQPELSDIPVLFRTTYQCGSSLYGSEVLITGGKLARRGEVPWHAGIYRKTSKTYSQICGGTLISNSIIISAAHCFWNGEEQQPPPERFAVAVGKIYQKWQSDIAEEQEQKSDVKEIRVPEHYQASDANYQEDIAVVIITSPFQYSDYVRPVCVDFRFPLEKKQLQTGNFGKVAGWGLTSELGGSAPALKLIKLPYVDTKTCIRESLLTFRGHITGDKFCAGYKNSNQAVCLGDSGGGLAFPLTEKGRTRYYLRGVVSAAPDSDRQCNANDITTFTRLLKHQLFIRQFWDFVQSPAATCDPVPAALTAHKIGQKGWDKCIEYQEKLVFPCGETVNGDFVRTKRCHHIVNGNFTDSNEVQQHEFSHMARLGRGTDINNLEWSCGGSLISEKFVVSSGVCTEMKDGVTYFVAVGDLNEINDKNYIKVKKIHRHPKFNLFAAFDDLGLLELEKTVTLSQFLVPACLPTGDNIIDDLAVTTKWSDDKPYEMKKILFSKTNREMCGNYYPKASNLCYAASARSYNQIVCHLDGKAYKLWEKSWEGEVLLHWLLKHSELVRDHMDLQSIEGGPIQVKNQKIACMYTVIGVRPFSVLCSGAKTPTLFAAIAPYVDWIERTVWP